MNEPSTIDDEHYLRSLAALEKTVDKQILKETDKQSVLNHLREEIVKKMGRNRHAK